jgi:uncharacterized protein (DUF1697 family)
MPSRTYAALLRGINVGGNNKLPMADVRALCDDLGHDSVVTYLQSGNVVFRSSRDPNALAAELEREIARRSGFAVTVLLRTPGELAAIASVRPFQEDDFKKVHVLFLSDRPTATALASLDPDRSPGDEFRANGRELYLHYANGSGRTRLTLDYFERRLGVAGTARNWNTVLKLVELTSG